MEHELWIILSRKHIDLQEIYIILCPSRKILNLLSFCLDHHNNPLTELRTKSSDIIHKTGALTFLFHNIAFPRKKLLSRTLKQNAFDEYHFLLLPFTYHNSLL